MEEKQSISYKLFYWFDKMLSPKNWRRDYLQEYQDQFVEKVNEYLKMISEKSIVEQDNKYLDIQSFDIKIKHMVTNIFVSFKLNDHKRIFEGFEFFRNITDGPSSSTKQPLEEEIRFGDQVLYFNFNSSISTENNFQDFLSFVNQAFRAKQKIDSDDREFINWIKKSEAERNK